MRLLGKWNWWAPGPLGRFADRLGLQPRRGRGHRADRRRDPGDRRGRRPACRRIGLIPPCRTASRTVPGRRRPSPTCSGRPAARARRHQPGPGRRRPPAPTSRTRATTSGGCSRPRASRPSSSARASSTRLLGVGHRDHQRRAGGRRRVGRPARGRLRGQRGAARADRARAGPAVMAFVGKEAYRGAFGERPELGAQARTLGDDAAVRPALHVARQRRGAVGRAAALVPRARRARRPPRAGARTGDRATLPGRATEVP